MKFNRNFFLLLSLSILLFTSGMRPEAPDHIMKLWYLEPAKQWTDALPVGNGRLGAMVFGKTDREIIQLNEESLWAGTKINNNNPQALSNLSEIRNLLLNDSNLQASALASKSLLGTPPRIRSYQTLGDLIIQLNSRGNVKNYRRELDLTTGIASTVFEQNGVEYSRLVFASAPDNVIAVRMKAKKGKINASVSLRRSKDATITATDNYLLLEGQINDPENALAGPGGKHMRFAAKAEIEQEGGKLTATGDSLIIQDAKAFTILLTAKTDYNPDILNFDPSIQTVTRCNNILAQAKAKPYPELEKTHIRDHQSMFNRVGFKICDEVTDTVPTDIRLKNVIAGKHDLHLEELYFQYGRYLLMGSSRAPGILPANLQGIWNKETEAPWNSDFHVNINLQMNYWLADACNLSETVIPLTNFFTRLMEPGSVTAREMYGCHGWTMHHLTDPFGRTGLMDGVQWGTFPMGGPWMSLHFWDHYLYTLDKNYLRNEAWPILKGAAQFVTCYLIPDKNGNLVTAPSYSPENTFYLPDSRTKMQLTYGATMDIQIIRELLNASISAAQILNDDPQFIQTMKDVLVKLPPTKIGKTGTIMEWIKDYEEAEPGHRHISHLFGLHPGTQISAATPELMMAARKTLERRLSNGGGHTGWSRAWIINFYARLKDSEKAYEHLRALLAKSTLSNLFDTHPPFQIDGNFGGTAGIAEMLLQSHTKFIDILPALPPAWKNGHISGLKARGNYIVDITWENGKLKKLNIKSLSGGTCVIGYNNLMKDVTIPSGQTYTFGENLNLIQ